MINLFLDTEFTSLEGNAKLISIALISEDSSRSFYAELTDTYIEGDCSDFVKNIVLPLLDASEKIGTDPNNIYAKMTRQKTAVELEYWLKTFGGTEESLVVWSDAPSYDWHWFSELLDLSPPYNVAKMPMQIEISKEYKQATERLFASSEIRQHHAFDDVTVIAKSYKMSTRE